MDFLLVLNSHYHEADSVYGLFHHISGPRKGLFVFAEGERIGDVCIHLFKGFRLDHFFAAEDDGVKEAGKTVILPPEGFKNYICFSIKFCFPHAIVLSLVYKTRAGQRFFSDRSFIESILSM